MTAWWEQTPKHDWASHGADAWRYLAMAWREPMPVEEEPDPLAGLLPKDPTRTRQTLAEMFAELDDAARERGEEVPDYT
jgi:hypothetical protein